MLLFPTELMGRRQEDEEMYKEIWFGDLKERDHL
jgi:hypothetical protein